MYLQFSNNSAHCYGSFSMIKKHQHLLCSNHTENIRIIVRFPIIQDVTILYHFPIIQKHMPFVSRHAFSKKNIRYIIKYFNNNLATNWINNRPLAEHLHRCYFNNIMTIPRPAVQLLNYSHFNFLLLCLRTIMIGQQGPFPKRLQIWFSFPSGAQFH